MIHTSMHYTKPLGDHDFECYYPLEDQIKSLSLFGSILDGIVTFLFITILFIFFIIIYGPLLALDFLKMCTYKFKIN